MNNQSEPKEKVVSQNIDLTFKMMNINDIKLHPQISGIFKYKPKMVENISTSMLEFGVDPSQPLAIARIKDIGDFLVDGHTRLTAAKKANIQELPVKIMEFLSLEDCQHYVIKRQVERRSISPDEIVLAAMLLENKKTRDGSGRSGKLLADTIGVSETTIIRAKTIAKDITDQELNELREGIESINSLYEKRKNVIKENNNIEIKKDNSTHAIQDNKIIDNDNISKSKTISTSEQQNNDIMPTVNNTINEKTEKLNLKNQELFSKIFIETIIEVVKILKENNEEKAIKLLLNIYKNVFPQEILYKLRKDYCQN